MWIRFKSEKRYAVKIYVGGVNAVSGEPDEENAATKLRRRAKLARGETIQDYVVVPDQKWLDGIATSVGQVRQFVAMPMGSGYSVEAQVTGKEVAGGIQIEITPQREEPKEKVFIKNPIGAVFEIPVDLSKSVADLRAAVYRSNAWVQGSNGKCRLIYCGKTMEGTLRQIYLHAEESKSG